MSPDGRSSRESQNSNTTQPKNAHDRGDEDTQVMSAAAAAGRATKLIAAPGEMLPPGCTSSNPNHPATMSTNVAVTQLMQQNVISPAPAPPQPQPQPPPATCDTSARLSDPTISSTTTTNIRSQLPQLPHSSNASLGSTRHSGQPPLQSQQPSQQPQWLAQVAAQTQLGVRQRMAQASDQFDQSLRQLYASASSIAADMPPSYHNIPGIVPYYHGRSVGPPPSYDDVINPYAPPPTYSSLFGQMREARKTSRGLLDLLRRLLIVLLSTLGCTILIAFMILIPFTMIIVGAVYIDECRIEHIPAFLLVGGLAWASKNIIHCYAQCRKMPSAADEGAAAETSSTLSSSSSSASSSSSSGASSSSGNELADNRHHHHHHHHRHQTAASELLADIYLSPRGGGGAHLEVLQPSSSSNTNSERVSGAATLAPSGGGLSSNLSGDQAAAARGGYAIPPTAASTTTRSRSSHRRRREQQQQQRQENSRRLKSSICESLLNCILFGWFIAGCVIVFRNYEPDFENSASARYCHRTVYMYTFWLISSAILLLGLFIGCICCLMVSSAVASRQDEVADDMA